MDRWTAPAEGSAPHPHPSEGAGAQGASSVKQGLHPPHRPGPCMVTAGGCCPLLVSPPTLGQGEPSAAVVFADVWKVHLQCLFHWNSLWNSELCWLLQNLSHIFQFGLNFTFVCTTLKKKHKHAINNTNDNVCSSTRWFGYVYGSPGFNLHTTELLRFTAGTVDHLGVHLYLDSPYITVIWIKLIF